MIYCIFLIFISIILENLSNIYLSSFNYFVPLFTLLSLIFIYPYFKKEKYKYYIFSSITGFIYDLFFTNFFVLNVLLFFICAFILYYIFNKFEYNFKTILFTSIFTIFLYNFLVFFILNFFMYTNYSLLEFSYILKYFLPLNLLYICIIYLFFKTTHIGNIIN